jgi:hypothetical protein
VDNRQAVSKPHGNLEQSPEMHLADHIRRSVILKSGRPLELLETESSVGENGGHPHPPFYIFKTLQIIF